MPCAVANTTFGKFGDDGYTAVLELPVEHCQSPWLFLLWMAGMAPLLPSTTDVYALARRWCGKKCITATIQGYDLYVANSIML